MSNEMGQRLLSYGPSGLDIQPATTAEEFARNCTLLEIIYLSR
jgi:hypothetical protein